MTVGILVVTDYEPLAATANAFTTRLGQFLTALADDAEIDVLVLQGESKVAAVNPLLGHTLRARAARLRHYTVGRLPFSAHPRRSPALDARYASSNPDLVVFHLPQTAHLAISLPASQNIVCILEEALERRHFDYTPGSTLHDLKSRLVAEGERRRWDRLYGLLGRRNVTVVVISDHEREWVGRRFPKDRIVVVPHAVDIEYFRPASERHPYEFDVAAIGNFAEDRNIVPLIRLLTAAQAAGHRDWRWVVAGNHESPPPRLPGSPRLTGFVDDLRPFYDRSKVIVVPSVGGSGVKTALLQAWSMGRPVVASADAVRGTPASDGDNVLVAPDPESMVPLCAAILASKELQAELGAAGRRTAEEHCDARIAAADFARLCLDRASGLGRSADADSNRRTSRRP